MTNKTAAIEIYNQLYNNDLYLDLAVKLGKAMGITPTDNTYLNLMVGIQDKAIALCGGELLPTPIKLYEAMDNKAFMAYAAFLQPFRNWYVETYVMNDLL